LWVKRTFKPRLASASANAVAASQNIGALPSPPSTLIKLKPGSPASTPMRRDEDCGDTDERPDDCPRTFTEGDAGRLDTVIDGELDDES
jgi:hypothetical protein